MKKILLSICILSFANTIFAQLPQLNKNNIPTIIKALTLEEKARLIMGLGMNVPGDLLGPNTSPPDTIKTFNPVAGSAGVTYAIPRLGIPAIVLADGPAGLRIDTIRPNDTKKYYCTAFPIGTMLASTWNEVLIQKVGKAIGNEVKERGVDVLLAPALNTHRNLLGGRNFEYYSEDPLISGRTAAAYINGVQANGVGTSIKHFAANNHEANRMKINVQVSQRAMREIYLRGFEYTITTSKPWTVMSSYNKLNGTYTSQNKDLITTILQDEWKFKGLVMTDWFSGDDGAAQMNAGNHMIMPGTKNQYNQIMAASKNGSLSEERLNKNVEKVLELILRSNTFKKYKFTDKPNYKENITAAIEAATEGIVLLKNNDNCLPLKDKKTKIALLGNASYKTVTGGSGSGDVNKAYSVSIYKGLQNTFDINRDFENMYSKYMTKAESELPKPTIWFMPMPSIAEKEITKAEAQDYASKNDIAVLTIRRTSGEFVDRKIEDDYLLNDLEKSNIKNISDAFHAKKKKLIVLLNIGGVIEIKSWEANADCILLTWQGGQEAGRAIASVVNGKVNPSGKLATTFPINYTDLSSAEGFPGTPDSLPTSIQYKDGIYVGYRYFEKFKVPVQYEFGYGLSYTKFEYSNLNINNTTFKDKITVSIEITNTGTVAGKEVVELYIGAPTATLDKPIKELKAFTKTDLLQPGKKVKLSFTINKIDLCSFNESQSAWIADAGEYKVYVGASSKNIKLTTYFTLPKTLVVKKVNDVLIPVEKIEELK
jgi:beta-glucosidase